MSTQTMTLDEATRLREKQIEDNRDLGVVEYRSAEAQSDAIYEVTEGYKHLPGGKRLGPGQRFHPTMNQVENDSLRGKAREIGRQEYAAVRHAKRVFAGADFEAMERKATAVEHNDPWYGLEMADSTKEYAVESGLTPEDFDGVEPQGANNRFLRDQVEHMVTLKASERTEA